MLPGKRYTVADIVPMVRRRLWIILVPLVFGLYVALVFSSLRREMYESEMLIQVVPQRVPDTYVQSTVTMRTEDRINALQQETLSRTTIESLITEMGLYADELKRMPMQDVIDLMRDNCKVVPVVKTIGSVRDAESFYVRFTYPDPVIAQAVTNRLGGLFIRLNQEDRGKISKGVDEFLQGQLGDKRRELEQTEGRLERFRRANAGRLPTQVDFNTQQISATSATLLSLSEKLAQDRNRKQMLEQRVADALAESATAPRGAPDADVSSNTPTGRSPQEQLSAARADLDKLLQRLKPEHPEVVKKKKEIRQLEANLETEAARVVQSPAKARQAETPEQINRRQRLAADQAEIQSLTRQIEYTEGLEKAQRDKLAQHTRNLEQVPAVESEWTALTRDYETQQAEYSDLLQKSSKSNVAVELERRQIGEQFRVLDDARVPLRPVGLPRAAVNGVGALAGLGLGIVLAALLELRDTSFSTGEDVLQVLQLPVVALVPYIVSDIDRRRESRNRRIISTAAVVLSMAGGYGIWALELWKHVV